MRMLNKFLMNKTCCATALFVVFALSTPTPAEIGTQEEAIQAGLHDHEPAYLSSVRTRLSTFLTIFSRQQEIATPTEELALLGAAEILFRLAHKDAIDAGRDAAAEAASMIDPVLAFRLAKITGDESVLGLAQHSLQKAMSEARPIRKHDKRRLTREENLARKLFQKRNDIERQRIKEKAYQEGLTLSEQALRDGAKIEEASRIAYRAAERVVFGALVERVIWQLPAFYRAELAGMKSAAANNPFIDTSSWTRFARKHFHQLGDSNVLLAPLVAVLDSWTEYPGALQFEAGADQDESIVSQLPAEIIRHIMTMVAPASFF